VIPCPHFTFYEASAAAAKMLPEVEEEVAEEEK